MKDQVDGFSRLTGTDIAAVLSGLLTLPERGAVQERVRLGDLEDATFRDRCHGEHWPVPIVEVYWCPPSARGYDQARVGFEDRLYP
ncbi:hypothetical protein [Desulfobulbus alkaliphilus]|uniref:hypothetical protein n=1 Tax=Desulfobulbus alkaliphilus TaxID=869814 RepID=UPI0019642A04|nr:hypothetical protein [Desulfobulbus alkaliphilus]MBM9535597.1 hypothetical protein [Desulfobulbus alkaliphilus]